MKSIQIACFALGASALFLSGVLANALLAPTAAQASSTWCTQGSSTVSATAKVQQGDDALFILSGETLNAYRTNFTTKKLELLGTMKLNWSDDK